MAKTSKIRRRPVPAGPPWICECLECAAWIAEQEVNTQPKSKEIPK
jgi:hypothetical protein